MEKTEGKRKKSGKNQFFACFPPQSVILPSLKFKIDAYSVDSIHILQDHLKIFWCKPLCDRKN